MTDTLPSAVSRLGFFEPPPGCSLEDENPVFAATREFAEEFGGPITRAFLQALPEDWRSAPLVVDSLLVWLPVGSWPGPLLFHREPYPESSEGAFRTANLDPDRDHIAVVLGPVGWDAVKGDVPMELGRQACVISFAGPESAATARDRALLEGIEEAMLSLESIAPGEVVNYNASTFIRYRPASHSGFQFSIRATSGSTQPLVNGFRTIV